MDIEGLRELSKPSNARYDRELEVAAAGVLYPDANLDERVDDVLAGNIIGETPAFVQKVKDSVCVVNFSCTHGSVGATVDGMGIQSGAYVGKGKSVVFTITPDEGYEYTGTNPETVVVNAPITKAYECTALPTDPRTIILDYDSEELGNVQFVAVRTPEWDEGYGTELCPCVWNTHGHPSDVGGIRAVSADNIVSIGDTIAFWDGNVEEWVDTTVTEVNVECLLFNEDGYVAPIPLTKITSGEHYHEGKVNWYCQSDDYTYGTDNEAPTTSSVLYYWDTEDSTWVSEPAVCTIAEYIPTANS